MDNESKDFTQNYNELKEREAIKREEERNKKKQLRAKVIIVRNSIIILIAIFVLLVLHSIISPRLNEYKYKNLTFNILDKIQYNFNGEFEVIAPTIDITKDVTPNVLYKIKDKNGIIFTVHRDKQFISTDYDQYLYKMYLMDYMKVNDSENIKYEDLKIERVGGEYYSLKFGVKISSYSNLDEELNKVYDLIKYIDSRAKRDFKNYDIYFDTEIYLNHFTDKIKHTIFLYDTEYNSNKLKIDYINYLVENKIMDVDVPKEDFDKYYRPSKMVLIMNGNTITDNVSFYFYTMSYAVPFTRIISSIKCIDNYVLKKDGELYSFSYKNKDYYYDSGLNQQIKGNKVSGYWSMKMLQEFFNAEVNYDYDNKTINIKISDNK